MDLSFRVWFIKRKLGLQPLMAILFVELLFSRLSDAVTLIELPRRIFHLPPLNLRLILTFCIALPLLLFWLINNKTVFKKFIFLYAFVDLIRLLYAIFNLIPSIGEYTGIKGGEELFTDVILVWSINVVVFGIWYWILDAGGPFKRNDDTLERRDFLFPQFGNEIRGWEKWKPEFIDYLFLAFNTSTTFGPTDAMVLSKRVKVLMMVLVVASLTSFAVIAARAVTILK